MNSELKNKIDAIIPAYNGARFILQALDSVVNQTLPPNKIIVVDDGSTDNTNKIVSNYAKNSKIEIKIVQKENGGLSSARNAGIKESNAYFIGFLDADDVWTPEKLSEQIKIFEDTEFGNLGLVYCDYFIIDKNGNVNKKEKKIPLNQGIRGSAFPFLLVGNKVLSSGSGVLIKKEVFNTVGYFDESLKYAEDWDMWLRISQKYEIDYSVKRLVKIRRHDENMTKSKLNKIKGEAKFYKKWLGKNKIQLQHIFRRIFKFI
ncbi:MAG: glycosyltransferase [Candidatus Pacebacteria bacterium]|nr:glycosyltransferase [Candidatus Paceibacterota bacterium]MCF7862614.1 glycosyltransferase [Candidatus Paceibacterota bacterium]